jgi:hypothetical protein
VHFINQWDQFWLFKLDWAALLYVSSTIIRLSLLHIDYGDDKFIITTNWLQDVAMETRKKYNDTGNSDTEFNLDLLLCNSWQYTVNYI